MDENILIMIDSYIDGELNQADEDILFEQLAVNPGVRNYFRKVNLMKKQIVNSEINFPSRLEHNIVQNVSRRSAPRVSRGVRIGGYLSVAVSIILLIISLLLLAQLSDYRTELNSALGQMQKQKQMINALYNSYPAAEVHARYSNEIIVKPNI